jgi:hypothetical protein
MNRPTVYGEAGKCTGEHGFPSVDVDRSRLDSPNKVVFFAKHTHADSKVCLFVAGVAPCFPCFDWFVAEFA